MAIDFTNFISRNFIPRDSNYEPMSALVGVNPSTGDFVPLALYDVGDGTFQLKVSVGSLTIPPITVGDVIIKATKPGDDTVDAKLTYYQYGAADYALKVREAQLDVLLSSRASETTLNSLLTNTPVKTLAGNDPVDIKIQTDKVAAAGPYVTTLSFATAGMYSVRGFKTKTIVVLNAGAKDADFRIFGSIDVGAAFDITILDSAVLPAGGTAVVNHSDYVTDVLIQARDNIAGQHTTIVTKLAAVPV